jgi:succinate-acetate transporter protein
LQWTDISSRNIAFFLIACAVLNVFFIIAALKVNVVYLLIFVTAGLGFTLLAAAFWALAEGAVAAGTSLQVVSAPVLTFWETVSNGG